jgi:hypothetical protein
MAGVYGEIDSRNDFFRVLGECQKFTGDLLRIQPKNRVIEVIDTQLDAMWRWTASGRQPTKDERKSIDISVHAIREIGDDTGDPATDAFVGKLHALNNYFEDWPTDDEAANATDDDFFDSDDDDEDDDE